MKRELFVLVRQADGFEQDDNVGYGGAVLRKAFRGLALDADVVDVEVEEVSDALSHFPCDGDDFWGMHDEDAIDVDDLEADQGDFFEGGAEEDGGVGAFPLGIGWREEGADVTGGDGSEQGVGDGMEEKIAVRVAGEALGVVEREAANAQQDAGFECMRVPAESEPPRP